METKITRKYLTISNIQEQYLPISKKRIRALAKQYLNPKVIGGRIFVERVRLEELLNSHEQDTFPLEK